MSNAHARSQYREFQRCTIDWCYSRLYGKNNNGTKRFLVADEVGLGKTMIAQGLISKLLERSASRSFVYVCSSLDIINQNRPTWDPTASVSSYQQSRITLIRAQAASRKRTRFYFLTPGTSLFIKNSTGIVEERLYMAWLAKRMFRISNRRAIELFKCNAYSFGDRFRDVRLCGYKHLSRREYKRLRREWRVLAKDIRYGARNSFRATVTSMRLKLAKIMLASLDPDLVILDEFKRFKDILMSSDGEIKEYLLLARQAPQKELLGYWKSGSHLISYLQEYVLGKKLRRRQGIAADPFLYATLKGSDARSRKIEYLAKDVFKTLASTLYLGSHLWRPTI